MINGFYYDKLEVLRPTFAEISKNIIELNHIIVSGIDGYDMILIENKQNAKKYAFTAGNGSKDAWWGQNISNSQYKMLANEHITPYDLI